MTSPTLRAAVPGAILGGLTLWAYAGTLADLTERWAADPQYSHGFLIGPFALYLLWARRALAAVDRPAPGWAFALLSASLGLRCAGAFLYLGWLEAVSLVPCLAGLVLLLLGPAGLRWSWPSIVFLVFLAPLPYAVQLALGGSLQQVATASATYVLQTLGVPAVAEGNVILLTRARVGVVEACNGLGMLVSFFAVTTACAFVSRAPMAERLAVVLSAAPIAVFANVVRIVVTAALYEADRDGAARAVYHDLAGWLLMPLALALVWAETAWLRRLFPLRPVGPAPVAGLPKLAPRRPAPPALAVPAGR